MVIYSARLLFSRQGRTYLMTYLQNTITKINVNIKYAILRYTLLNFLISDGTLLSVTADQQNESTMLARAKRRDIICIIVCDCCGCVCYIIIFESPSLLA